MIPMVLPVLVSGSHSRCRESLPFVPSAAAANVKQLQSDLRTKISGLQDAADRQVRQSKESLILTLAQKKLYRDFALIQTNAQVSISLKASGLLAGTNPSKTFDMCRHPVRR